MSDNESQGNRETPDRDSSDDGHHWPGTIIDAAEARAHPETADDIDHIESLRRSVDALDAEMITLLAERFRVTDAIGRLKANAGFAPEDEQREREQAQRLRRLAQECGLDGGIARGYLLFVVDEAKRRHERISAVEGSQQE